MTAKSGEAALPDRAATPVARAAGPPTAWASPTRRFALLSLLTIGDSALVFGYALAYFVERGILDREG